ncbi:MAG: DUF1843 domain-containing protein [Terracidiphilus sp.]
MGLLPAAVLLMVFTPSQALRAQQPHRITEEPGSEAIRITVSGAGRHTLEVDDAPGFRTPVFSRVFQGGSIVLHTREAGLIPGIRYLVRIDRGAATDLHLSQGPAVQQPGLNCELLQATWRESGRFFTGVAHSQMKWDEGAHRWTPILPAVPLGDSLYYVEQALRPALSAARACNDLQTMDEIALYYTAMLDKTQTIASLLRLPNLLQETRDRMSGSEPEARTFAARFGPDAIGEGELYNSQWLHPAALLIRLVSQLPESERTPGMRLFLTRFTPFLVREQLLRFALGHGDVGHRSLAVKLGRGSTGSACQRSRECCSIR